MQCYFFHLQVYYRFCTALALVNDHRVAVNKNIGSIHTDHTNVAYHIVLWSYDENVVNHNYVAHCDCNVVSTELKWAGQTRFSFWRTDQWQAHSSLVDAYVCV